jgi:hypothetical protein
MAKKTIRKNDIAVLLNPDQSEFLEYRLQVSGARANCAWADDKKTVVLTHLDFDEDDDELVWQLKTEITPHGTVKVTVPQNPGYQREEASGSTPRYALTLAFVTATKYTLTVRRCKQNGATLGNPTDIDYEMQQQGESLNEGLFAALGKRHEET